MRAWRDGLELDTGSPQQRATLALLLLREGRPVSLDEIIDALWGEATPKGAQATARTYIYRIRRALAHPKAGGEVVVSSGGGYALPAENVTVDLWSSRRHVALAREARERGDTGHLAKLLGEALACWTGRPLAGAHGWYVDQQRAELDRFKLTILEERLAADLDLGRHSEVIGELTDAVSADPLRESLRELLMLALYRSGRQAEALAAFDDVRRKLGDELGIDPGPGLRTLHERILRADPELLGPPQAAARPQSPADAVLTPASIPAASAHFVGRTAELGSIIDRLGGTGRAAIVGVTGLSGMGKTAIAIQAAHSVRSMFPDGQVYADMRGSHSEPVDAYDVLGAFLSSYGVTGDRLPTTLHERAACWRSVLSGRKVLVFLDDAGDPEQVRHLLPATQGSAAILTSNRRMVELPSVQWVNLTPLSPEESLELLAIEAGRERVLRERDAAIRLAALCSHHPLALRLAAARMTTRPLWTVAQIEAVSREELRGLTHLGPDCTVLARTFRRAMRSLTEEQALAFRLAAVPDWTYLTVPAVAALLNVTPPRARALLEALTDAHLLEAAPSGRYFYLGIVKVYARCTAWADDGPDACHAALQRLVRFYLTNAEAAVRSALPLQGPTPGGPTPGGALPATMTYTPARGTRPWPADSRSDILAVLDQVDDLPEATARRLRGLILREWRPAKTHGPSPEPEVTPATG
ncbi:DNA-binding SARP family transcriptional activator/RecA/RadA recombinase [Thermocatellispora tengchongensis]|uniref:DNA-binding SARP family transcriptional activator/RecA/RadA recombinase n=1 Tax=Thermocatellispora tengchongensis TaxID=1073253 RepID=A0A840PI43_9ACTN|nr:AfsR/SARP family transcriptional regulator [Thermocatellispora tengchongensis]MBB5139218.1 DNA-binding SARP family transcriptional activator/RecA/RadA recombinase [Thermocatellispora tengchongensis]